jgi:4-amino-4-deoxy-L-arabinose transferase-like glycosyltransferase
MFGSYEGWIITNIVATILTALLIALILKNLVKGWISVLAYTIYLLLPLTLWQTAQPLAEATITCFVAIGMLIYIKADRNPFLWALLLVVACLAYYCRATFSPILLVIPVAYLVHSKPCNIKTILVASGLLCFVCVVLLTKGIIFPQMTVSFPEILNTGLPGQSNMSAYFAIPPSPPIVLSNLYSKIVSNLSTQIVPNSWLLQLFYLPFNVLAALSVYLLFIRKTNSGRRIAYCGGILLLLHIATILIFQNQFRYLLIPIPAVLACSALVIDKIKLLQSKRVQTAVLLGVFIALMVVNTPIAIDLHHQGLQEKELCTTLKSVFDDAIPESDSLMVAATGKYLKLGYVLRPRTTVFLRPVYDHDDYQIMRERVNAKWLLCPKKRSSISLE